MDKIMSDYRYWLIANITARWDLVDYPITKRIMDRELNLMSNEALKAYWQTLVNGPRKAGNNVKM